MFPDTRAFCFHLKPGYCTPPEDGNQRGEPQTLSATCTHPTDDLTLQPRPLEPMETRRNPRAKPVSQKLSEKMEVSGCTPQTKAEQKCRFLLLSSSLPPLNASGDLPMVPFTSVSPCDLTCSHTPPTIPSSSQRTKGQAWKLVASRGADGTLDRVHEGCF